MLINGQKWACETCIKGHRATHCNHTTRKLVQIKKKGRPSTQCSRCKELRIVRQLHVKCNCIQTSDSNSGDASKRKDLSNPSVPKKKRKTTKLRPLAPKETTTKSNCCSKTPSLASSIPSPITHITTHTATITSLSTPIATSSTPSITPVSSLPPPSSSCCSSKTQPIIPPILTAPPAETPTGCCSSNEKTKTTSSHTSIIDESPSYQNDNHSSISPTPPMIQNPTPPEEQDNPPSPYIPPPTSCCGPPTKNKNGENIRIVTCRCGDSCACPGCDAHPSRAMKDDTKDVYYGFEENTDFLNHRRISISNICEEEVLCGCGCNQLFENCSGCFNDLCQCSYL